MKKLPAYTKNKMKGNIGEALVQYVLSKFCLVHKIDGSNDIGNDMICELIKDQSPTNLLFYVQVKYTQTEPRIRRETLNYWKSSPIPVFLFWIKDDEQDNWHSFSSLASEQGKIQYKRYTVILHNKNKHQNEEFQFYDELKFKEDLFIDYARSQYKKGFTPIIDARDFLNINEKIKMGIKQYVLLTKRVIPEYSQDILKRSWVNIFTTAILLKNKGDHKSLVEAKKAIELAEILFDRGEKKKHKAFLDSIRDHKKEIDENLKKFN